MMDETELKRVELLLTAGLPVDIENVCNIYSPTLKEIALIGEDYYNTILSYVLLDKNKLEDFKEIDESIFNIFCVYYYHDEQFRKIINDGLKLFLREDVELRHDEERVFFIVGGSEDGGVIDEAIFNKLREAVKVANKIKIEDEPEYNPANSMAQKMVEMIKKNKSKKPKKKEIINLQSIISGLAWKSNSVNIFNVFDLTIYQLYDGFYRLENIDNYNHTLTGIYTGNVDSKKINMSEINWAKIIKT